MITRSAAASTDRVVLERLDVLERRVRELEARFRPGDAADVQALMAIATAIGGRDFTSRKLWTIAGVDSALGAALDAADIVNVYDLGHLLARLTVRVVDDVAVERLEHTRAGWRWRIVPRR